MAGTEPPTPAALPGMGDLARLDLTERRARLLQQARADALAAALAADWADFASWCDTTGHRPLPATADTVAAYLRDTRGDRGEAERRLLAIAYIHRTRGLGPPSTRSRVILRALGEQPAARPKGQRPSRRHPAAPLTGQLLAAALATCDPATPRGRRDRALLTLGHAAGWRRGQLVGLDWEDLEEGGRGLRIAAQPGRPGQELAHTAHQPDHAGPARARCPVCAVAAWRVAAAAALKVGADQLRGPVFGPVNRHGRLRAAVAGGWPVAVRLDAGTVSQLVKARVRAALARRRPRPGHEELERTVAGFSGDSLRAGWQAERRSRARERGMDD